MIIGIAGKKRSGKNTFGNYITGRVLKDKGLVKDFFINEEGKLLVETAFSDGSIDWGVLDLDRRDEEFYIHASQTIWPYVKCYSFAKPLKDMIIDLFDVSEESVYGNEEQRNVKTHINWEDMPGEVTLQGPMSGIEIMQYFGTEVMRRIYDNVWVNKTIRTIQQEQPEIAIITDLRFLNEAKAIRKNKGRLIKLTRNVLNLKHESEIALDGYRDYDMVIDNSMLSHEDFINTLSFRFEEIAK